MTNQVVGTSPFRKEGANKITGAAKYTADHTEPGLLHAKLKVSPYAHAKIVKIDVTEALLHAGVKAVVDICIKYGFCEKASKESAR